MVSKELCPCGTGVPFENCCQPYLLGDAIAPTPEALMRSRYSAFSKSAIDYLLKTHHPSKCSVGERASLQQTCLTTRWKRLMVIESGLIHDAQGYVEFMAVYDSGGLAQLHERSNFVKESDEWFYLDGKILLPVQPTRRELCWCGSGKKYKRCHG